MVSPYNLVTSVLLSAIAATAIAALAWGLLAARQYPEATFLLRLFHNLQELARGLRAIDLSLVLLALAFLPALVGWVPPEPWSLVFVAAATAEIWYGLILFVKAFRVRKGPRVAAAKEAERGPFGG